MGQYYKFIILDDDKKNGREVILLVINPHDFNEGAKLMEHSYLNTNIMNTVEFLLGSNSQFYKSRVVWAGDYADNEDSYECPENLYRLSDNYSSFRLYHENQKYKYIVNHTKKLYVDKIKSTNSIHPLPLLISEGNGLGGGDYRSSNEELCGTWARNVISMENEIPDGYNELLCNFEEY